jgi:hypothetical protein
MYVTLVYEFRRRCKCFQGCRKYGLEKCYIWLSDRDIKFKHRLTRQYRDFCLCIKFLVASSMPFIACPRPSATGELGRKIVFKKLLTISERATAQMFQRLLSSLMFLGVLWGIVGMVVMSQPVQVNIADSTFPMLRKRSCVTGWLTEVTQHVLLIRELYCESWIESLAGNHLPSGTVVSSNDIPKSDWENLRDLTQSGLSASIGQLSMSTLFSLDKCWTSTTFHGAMSIIWMRKGVNEEAVEGCKPSNTLYLEIGALNTRCEVQIWNSSQLLNASALTEKAQNLDSYFLERNSIQNGLKLMMVLGQAHRVPILVNLME